MSSNTAQLNELIAITRDGQRFYEHARAEVRDARLRSLFRDLSQVKGEVIQALASKVVDRHEVPFAGGTVVGRLRQVYADTRASLAGDEEAVYVAQLEGAEDRILHAFEDALECAEADVRAVLVAEMPKVQACHERLRSFRHEMP
ncbi:PA2169 family four-helix-bundle protein [Pseudomonas sp. CrR25]|nr:PA2169 family four-helix-bundle protein [Pseudomonas sp. CrR25]